MHFFCLHFRAVQRPDHSILGHTTHVPNPTLLTSMLLIGGIIKWTAVPRGPPPVARLPWRNGRDFTQPDESVVYWCWRCCVETALGHAACIISTWKLTNTDFLKLAKYPWYFHGVNKQTLWVIESSKMQTSTVKTYCWKTTAKPLMVSCLLFSPVRLQGYPRRAKPSMATGSSLALEEKGQTSAYRPPS